MSPEAELETPSSAAAAAGREEILDSINRSMDRSDFYFSNSCLIQNVEQQRRSSSQYGCYTADNPDWNEWGDGRPADTAHGGPAQRKWGGRHLAGPAQRKGDGHQSADPARKKGNSRHPAGPRGKKETAATPPDQRILTHGSDDARLQTPPEQGQVRRFA